MSGTGWTQADAKALTAATTFLADIATSAASIAASLRANALRPDADEPACDEREREWCHVHEVQDFGDAEPRRIRTLRLLPDPEGA